MTVKIEDCWEEYSKEEFILRKSLLTEHVEHLRIHSEVLSDKVKNSIFQPVIAIKLKLFRIDKGKVSVFRQNA